jgi:hypothetical protein
MLKMITPDVGCVSFVALAVTRGQPRRQLLLELLTSFGRLTRGFATDCRQKFSHMSAPMSPGRSAAQQTTSGHRMSRW